MRVGRGENRECDWGGKKEEKNGFLGQPEGKKLLGRIRCEDSAEADINRNRVGGRGLD
jgi:hypothetical protein